MEENKKKKKEKGKKTHTQQRELVESEAGRHNTPRVTHEFEFSGTVWHSAKDRP